jgi:RNA polymerase sigma-70 factor (ECF subfamily)
MLRRPFSPSRPGPAQPDAAAASPGASAASAAGEAGEARLIARVVDADLAAFEALYRLYHPRLTRFLERVTRRQALVDELLNDTMLVVWNQASRYNGRSKVSTWIFAIAYRKALKALSRLDEAMEDPQALEHAEPGDGPEQQMNLQQVRERLALAMDQLSAEHRAVVDLTYYHGLGYREIAEIVDCPLDTVKTRMFHARRRLKAMFAGRLGDWL